MHQAAPSTPSGDVIHCIGDSHVSFFSGQDVIQPGWPACSQDLLPYFVTHHIGPALAYNLPRVGTQTRGRECLFEVLEQAVPPQGKVLLCFGEIDCRAHILKQAARRNAPVAQVVDECLDSYFQVVREVQARGFEVLVYNAVPSRLRSPRSTKRDDDYVVVGSWQERNAAVRLFNAGAKQRCQIGGTKFLENYPSLVDGADRTVEWFFFDTIHLSQRAMPLTLRGLAELFPNAGYPVLPLPQPSWSQKIFDRAAKRVRRWLKIKPPSTTFTVRT
jgi:hypothetical protein